LLLGAAGAGVAILGYEVLLGSKSAPSPQGHPALPTASSSSSTSSSAEPRVENIKVKVRYFQMAGTLPGLQVEYFDLLSPARFSQLRAEVIDRHPAVAGMIPTMLVLIDGLVAKDDTPLNDGDEVDFIPTVSGG
jgi:molybdopterin converting factor small subunit